MTMKSISAYLLTDVLGWKIKGEFPDVKKSIIIFAPHTSYHDALYGKLFFTNQCIKYNFLSKNELFFFPMNIAMKLYGSIPVRLKNINTINHVVKLLNEAQELHIIISPEGAIENVTKWNKGFYYMAVKAKVPIIVGYLDYEKKEIGIKGIIENPDNISTVMQQINLMYKDVTAKYPSKFSLEEAN